MEGSEIPGIYFDYLRTGDARGLQPVFYHNALDVISLAALTVELAHAVERAGSDDEVPSLDLFSLSRIFERAGATDRSVATCRRALAAGLPETIEARALWQLASQHKRRRQYHQATEIWLELSRREERFAIQALEELAIYHEHGRRSVRTALQFAEKAVDWLRDDAGPARTPQSNPIDRFTHRLERLRRKSARASARSLRPGHS